MQLSRQQQAVLDWAQNALGSLILIARAGCGKTSTLLALVNFLVSAGKGNIFIGAFNKPIAEEIKAKLAKTGVGWKQAKAGTMHGAGFGAWCKMAPHATVEGHKLLHILDAIAEQGEPRKIEVEIYGAFVAKAVSLAKQRAFGVLSQIEDRGKWFDLFDHFGLEEDLAENADMDRALDLCIEVYRLSLSQCKQVIDYDDMILAPLYFKARFWQHDWILIDESQDTNPARRALALAMLKPTTGRLVAVGDPAQAIYGFTGADSDSMEIIQRQLNAAELPLNTTYRCPKAIVRLAQSWVKDINAADNAPEGIVRNVYAKPTNETEADAAFALEVFNKEDAILCRNTKPLVELAYSLLRRGIACHVEGREIGQGLVKIIRKWQVKNISTLLASLADWRDAEVQKWLAKGKEAKAEAVADQCETIQILAERLMEEGKTRVDDLIGYINGLFTDTEIGQDGKPRIKALTLSTVHKSKGREWDRVYLLGRNKYMPSKWARKDWQMEQENNLCYVAVTRAKQELIEVVVE